MVLVRKWPFFRLFFFGNIGQENVFQDILERKKTPFQAIKAKTSKSRKIGIFPKGLTHGFCPIMAILVPLLPKKKVEKWPFLNHNVGLTHLDKCQFFDFLNFLFLQARKAFFFALEYRKRGFRGLYCLKKKVGKIAIFFTKTMG